MGITLEVKQAGDVIDEAYAKKEERLNLLCIKTFISGSSLHLKAGSFYSFKRDEEGYTVATGEIQRFRVFNPDVAKKESYKHVLSETFKLVSEDEMIKIRFIYPVNDLKEADAAIVKAFNEFYDEQELLKNRKLYQVFQAGTILTEVFWELPVNRLSFLNELLTPLYNTEDWKWLELDVDYADYASYGN